MWYNSHYIINIQSAIYNGIWRSLHPVLQVLLSILCINGLYWIVSLLSLCSWFWVLEAALCWAWHQPRGHCRGVRHWGHWPERCVFLSGKLHKYRLMMHSERASHQPHPHRIKNAALKSTFYLSLYINHGVAI